MPSQEVKEEGGEGPGKILLFDVTRGLACRVPTDQAGQAGWRCLPVSHCPYGSHPSTGRQNLGSTRGHMHYHYDEGRL